MERLTYPQASSEDSEMRGCPLGYTDPVEDGVMLSTNWEYLQNMKMNEVAPAANMGPVTRPGGRQEGKPFSPWFWPDSKLELARAVKFRQAAFLEDQDRVLQTAGNDPVVRAASQQLLWLQSQYLVEHFPDTYAIEQDAEFGRIIVNKATDDKFAIRPEKADWHPLAISGMLSQEDICVVQRKKSGRQVLVAGFLATPTHWNLSNFMNADMDKIHKQVRGYHKPVNGENRPRLKETVDKTLEVLREYPNGLVSRNNQFIEYTPLLALEPDTETDFKEKKIIQNPGDRIFLRSERETLTRLPAPYDDFTIFTIKPNVFRMSDVRQHRGADFARAVTTNAIIRSSLKSNKKAKSDQKFDFTELLQKYLSEIK